MDTYTAGWLVDAAPVASAVFAAVAATASFLSVRQARRIWEAERRPQLHAQALTFPPPSQEVALVIHNGGGKLAKGTGFAVVRAKNYSFGYVLDGFMRPGETAYVTTDLSAGPVDPVAVMFCRDSNENTYAWNLAGDLWEIPRRDWLGRKRTHVLTDKDFLRHFYPEIDAHDLFAKGHNIRRYRTGSSQ